MSGGYDFVGGSKISGRGRETAHMHFIKRHYGGCRALLVMKERAVVVVSTQDVAAFDLSS